MTDDEKIKQDIEDIKNGLNAVLWNIKRIEKSLSRDTYIPKRWLKIRYSHDDRQLVFDDRFKIDFKKNEAELLGLLFYKSGKKSGMPRSEEFLIAKIAKDNERLNLKPSTHKATYQAYKRIYDRIFIETRIEMLNLSYNTVSLNKF